MIFIKFGSMNDLELLAPAGTIEKMHYAFAFGADAVYAGQPQFSLRARENGFQTVEDVAYGIEYAHNLGKKFYLASNIIPHNNKINSFTKALDQIIEVKPDALIMTDPGMIHYVRQNHPDQEVHLSVQGNCTNWSTAKFWYDMGVKRIILSRELRLREIIEIHDKVPEVELEVFVHGAVCMAHSGRCLLSNYMSMRDSNQGACSNACRFNYSLYAGNEPQGGDQYVPLEGEFFLEEQKTPGDMIPIDEDEYGTYIMNSKDMCAIAVLDQLAEAGVVSFKIEGRTKSQYYLSQVCKSYRGAVDDVLAGRPIAQEHINNAHKTEGRGFFPGFFVPERQIPQNYEATRVQSETGSVVGIVRGWDTETSEAIIDVKGKFETGDQVEVSMPKSSEVISAGEMRNHKGKPTDVLNSGVDKCRIKLDADPGEYAFLVKRHDIIKELETAVKA